MKYNNKQNIVRDIEGEILKWDQAHTHKHTNVHKDTLMPTEEVVAVVAT